MAQRAQPVTIWIGIGALVLTGALILLPPLTLIAFAGGAPKILPYDWSVICFTLLQACLSAVISVILAVPVARALARRDFRGRGAIVTLLGAPFLLPVIVAIFGLLAVWGRSGWVSSVTTALGGDPVDIYGLTGILLAHVFFNLPLATRLILQGWSQIPAEHFRLSAQLSFHPLNLFRHLEWPMLKSVLPGAFLLVFLLCITSFAVALTLGGGPKATTIELAIYESIRFDFDLPHAAMLAMIQFSLCILVALLSLKFSVATGFGGGLTRTVQRWDTQTLTSKFHDVVAITLTTIFLMAPLLAVFLRGVAGIFSTPRLLTAIISSLSIALGSALFAVLLGLTLARFIDILRARSSRWAGVSEIIGLITLAASPFVLGTGLFLIINPFLNPFALALPVTALVNAMIALPITLRVLLPALEQNRATYGQLTESLGISGWTQFRLVTWPAIKAPLGFATGLAAAFSMGDLGVITLFAPPDVETLPLLMYRLMGTYRMDAAAAVALVLVALTLALFWLFDRGGRLGHHL